MLLHSQSPILIHLRILNAGRHRVLVNDKVYKTNECVDRCSLNFSTLSGVSCRYLCISLHQPCHASTVLPYKRLPLSLISPPLLDLVFGLSWYPCNTSIP